jgi:hypothetical protein
LFYRLKGVAGMRLRLKADTGLSQKMDHKYPRLHGRNTKTRKLKELAISGHVLTARGSLS